MKLVVLSIYFPMTVLRRGCLILETGCAGVDSGDHTRMVRFVLGYSFEGADGTRTNERVDIGLSEM